MFIRMKICQYVCFNYFINCYKESICDICIRNFIFNFIIVSILNSIYFVQLWDRLKIDDTFCSSTIFSLFSKNHHDKMKKLLTKLNFSYSLFIQIKIKLKSIQFDFSFNGKIEIKHLLIKLITKIFALFHIKELWWFVILNFWKRKIDLRKFKTKKYLFWEIKINEKVKRECSIPYKNILESSFDVW